jgi:hypothetical protein
MVFYDSLADAADEWSTVCKADDIFLSPEFLQCVEDFAPEGIKPYYCLIKDEKLPVGILYFQTKYVKLKENLRQSNSETKTSARILTEPFKQSIISLINFPTIICGNLLLTGKYGFCFKNSIPRDDQFYIVSKATDKLRTYLEQEGKSIKGLILIKDFFEADAPVGGEYHHGFTKFSVQPKMLLDINPDWNNFNDYLLQLKSKYRVRARKAFKNGEDIVKKEFDATEIATHRDTINALYKNVSDQANFNAFVLHKRYFESLKATLGKAMIFTTYWRNGKMVAFFTSIKNYDILDAHFLGYDPTENTECQIYLNMLYDLIDDGIRMRVKQIDMSRTAIEIKSTVGAVPHDMYLYLRHTNKILNRTVGLILSLVKPDTDFIIRSPFREN